jgi:hypothetical protein
LRDCLVRLFARCVTLCELSRPMARIGRSRPAPLTDEMQLARQGAIAHPSPCAATAYRAARPPGAGTSTRPAGGHRWPPPSRRRQPLHVPCPHACPCIAPAPARAAAPGARPGLPHPSRRVRGSCVHGSGTKGCPLTARAVVHRADNPLDRWRAVTLDTYRVSACFPARPRFPSHNSVVRPDAGDELRRSSVGVCKPTAAGIQVRHRPVIPALRAGVLGYSWPLIPVAPEAYSTPVVTYAAFRASGPSQGEPPSAPPWPRTPCLQGIVGTMLA